MSRIDRITRLELVTGDAARAADFYTGLGFRPAGTAGQPRRLRLGGQEIALVEDTTAPPYPTPRAANDPWFQHFAIAVADIDAAVALAIGLGAVAISRGGPQRLPANTGSVTAWKFRDPDGHPLEFSFIPGSSWLGLADPGPCLGIDHTAIAVRDLPASLAFYAALGFRETGRSLNRGPEQDRLDGLPGVAVDIVALTPPGGGLHLELLSYRTPPAAAMPGRVDGVAATRTVIAIAASASLWTDPDGHLLKADA